MYVPSSFDVPDGRILESFISRYGFATLITSSSAGLIASHIPITLRKRGDANCLIGHVARANNQWRAFDGKAEALAIFHGPHAYTSTVSPLLPKIATSPRLRSSTWLQSTKARAAPRGARKALRPMSSTNWLAPLLRLKCPSRGSKASSN